MPLWQSVLLCYIKLVNAASADGFDNVQLIAGSAPSVLLRAMYKS